MNFLEKDLETIIWEQYEACQQRGLRINFAPFEQGKRIRQMNLMPLGIADLVSIYYDPIFNECWLQVIECKRGKVTGDTYLQAKRYMAALEELLQNTDLIGAHTIKVHTTIVLIGASVDTSTSLIHTIATDRSCLTYTYSYGVDGIRFDDKSNYWWLDGSPLMSHDEWIQDTHELGGYIRECQYAHYKHRQTHGDPTQPLLVTSDGVLFNPELSQL